MGDFFMPQFHTTEYHKRQNNDVLSYFLLDLKMT
nr:MAG TPA: hypothetical protein [Caudoviricetes sp.]